MFNGQYKSISTVIENILRDNDYYNDVDQNDMTEWAVRAMELIGAPIVYDEVIDTIEVVDYRAALPSGVREIKGVRDHESRQTLVASTDEWIEGMYKSTQTDTSGADTPDPYPGENRRLRDKGMTGLFSYQVKRGWIYLNAKEGWIDVKYTTFPTDDNGCLLIPDVDRYMLAVEAYIKHKLDNKLFRRGVISKSIRDESEREWIWYVQSAFNKVVTPDYDKAESMKNQIKKIRTDGNAHDYGFSEMNLPTERRVDRNRTIRGY